MGRRDRRPALRRGSPELRPTQRYFGSQRSHRFFDSILLFRPFHSGSDKKTRRRAAAGLPQAVRRWLVDWHFHFPERDSRGRGHLRVALTFRSQPVGPPTNQKFQPCIGPLGHVGPTFQSPGGLQSTQVLAQQISHQRLGRVQRHFPRFLHGQHRRPLHWCLFADCRHHFPWSAGEFSAVSFAVAFCLSHWSPPLNPETSAILSQLAHQARLSCVCTQYYADADSVLEAQHVHAATQLYVIVFAPKILLGSCDAPLSLFDPGTDSNWLVCETAVIVIPWDFSRVSLLATNLYLDVSIKTMASAWL